MLKYNEIINYEVILLQKIYYSKVKMLNLISI